MRFFVADHEDRRLGEKPIQHPPGESDEQRSIQKISREVPGAGFVFEEAAPASSMRLSNYQGGNIAAARKQFKT